MSDYYFITSKLNRKTMVAFFAVKHLSNKAIVLGRVYAIFGDRVI